MKKLNSLVDRIGDYQEWIASALIAISIFVVIRLNFPNILIDSWAAISAISIVELAQFGGFIVGVVFMAGGVISLVCWLIDFLDKNIYHKTMPGMKPGWRLAWLLASIYVLCLAAVLFKATS